MIVIEEWDNHVLSISRVVIVLNDQENTIVWDINILNGVVIVKSAYNVIPEEWDGSAPSWWDKSLWSRRITLKKMF